MQKLEFSTWFTELDTLVFRIAQLFFDGKGYEISGTKTGYVIFSDLKITIRSCLEAVVLIEADIQGCFGVGEGYRRLTLYNSFWGVVVDECLPNLWDVICSFFVNLELELAITHG